VGLQECLITQELIDGSKSIGLDLLKTFIPDKLWENMFWGLSIGTIDGVKIKTEKNITHEGKKKRIR
jgi:hypothetical protein